MSLEPKIIKVADQKVILRLVGCIYYGNPFHSVEGWNIENEIGLTWKRFEQLYKKYPDFFQDTSLEPSLSYEVHIQPESYQDDKKFYVFVGVEAPVVDRVPLELFYLVLPPSRYAMFRFTGKQMFTGGEFIWNDWLPSSDYREAHPFMIQRYDQERFFGLNDEKSELDWLVPVVRK